MADSQQIPHITMTGLSHRTAPLEVREQLTLTRAQLPAALQTLKAATGGGVIVATCNRMEIYTAGSDSQRDGINRFFARQFGVEPSEFGPYTHTLQDTDAVRHLFRVTSSLDSLIIGESEILGQVRDAFSAAAEAEAVGGIMTRLFHDALRVGKRARHETAIGQNALSVSRACVELARRSLGSLVRKHVLVVGVGEASKLAAQALHDAGVRRLIVTNRTPEHAEELARNLGGDVAPFSDLNILLADADVVITATGSPSFIISQPMVKEASAFRPDRPLFIMDIAVPRDVEPAVAELPNVFLHDIDHLEMIAESNRRERMAEAVKVTEIVEQEVGSFHHWLESQEVTPTIAAIRKQAEAIRREEIERTLQKMGHLSAEDRLRIDALSKALVKKLLHTPTNTLRSRRDIELTERARELFRLDDE